MSVASTETVERPLFSDDQIMLADMLSAFLSDRYDFESRAKILKSQDRWSPDIWDAFASELGILGAAFDERAGGLGGGVMEHVAIQAALGEVLAIEPYFETCVVAGGMLKRSTSSAAAALVAGIIDGSVRFAVPDPVASRIPLSGTVRLVRSVLA